MADETLRGRRILVAEDEYMLADDLRNELVTAGAIVLGPVGTVADALHLMNNNEPIDGAILDINLGGETAISVADALAQRNVPLVFTTGYDGSMIPARFDHVVKCEKPLDIRQITQVLGHSLQS